MDIDIDIVINDDQWQQAGFDPETETSLAIQAALNGARYPKPLTKARPLELSVNLTSNAEIQALNRTWRGKDKPTNILSFASIDDPDFRLAASLPGPFHLGDLVLAWGVVAAEAAEQRKTLHDHFAHLLIHGTLHLLGYDHEVEAEAETMEALEIDILKRLGIENPYAEAHFMPD
jgi:probable rRNA maturation factor